MTRAYTKKQYKAAMDEVTAEMMEYPGMTEPEAYVLALIIVVTRGWPNTAMDERGYSEDKCRELQASGSRKYKDGGGNEYFSG